MSSDARNNKPGQLARNTMALYLRTALMLVINLYTSRVILRVFGVDDFAIYSIIGNFVATFTIVTSTFTIATQRFITVAIGKGDEIEIKRTFSTALSIHLVIAILLVILCEFIGVWYFREKLIIDADRIHAAQMVFHCSLLSMLFQFISIPYTSLMIAYEHMGAWAWISITEVLLKLVAVIVLPLLPADYDYLIWYAVFLATGALLIRIIYGIYSNIMFPHCKYQWVIDKQQTREMSKFMGWNVLGIGADIVSKQFITLLLNSFFILAVNAARGIAVQAENAVVNFTRQISMAFNPQITKSYTEGNHERLIYLVRQGSKFGFFLYLVVCIPLIAETPSVLNVWLGEYPDYTIVFLRLSLVNSLLLTFSFTLDTMVFASGKIRNMEIWTAVLMTACFPISHLMFQQGLPPYICYLVTLVMTVALLVVKYRIASRLLPNCSLGYSSMILCRCLPTAGLAASLPIALHSFGIVNCSLSMFLLLFYCIIYAAWSLAIIYIVGLNSEERKIALQYISRRKCQ